MSAEFPFMRMKQSKWTVVMVALPCDYTKYSLNYILKMINMVNFMLCVPQYLKSKDFKTKEHRQLFGQLETIAVSSHWFFLSSES